jgi:hypothetical protein
MVNTKLTIKQVQTILDQPTLLREEIQECLEAGNILLRAKAILELRKHPDDDSVQSLVLAAQNPANQVMLMGVTKLSHLAIACLQRLDTPDARRAVAELYEELTMTEREDIEWFNRSEQHGVLA